MFQCCQRLKFATFVAFAAAPLLVRSQTNSSVQINGLQNAARGWSLGWQSSATGTAYTVQFQDTLQDVIWRIPSSSAQFPLGTNSWLDTSITNTARFFRVLAVPTAERGKILSATLGSTLSTATISFLLSFASVSITPQYDYLESITRPLLLWARAR